MKHAVRAVQESLSGTHGIVPAISVLLIIIVLNVDCTIAIPSGFSVPELVTCICVFICIVYVLISRLC